MSSAAPAPIPARLETGASKAGGGSDPSFDLRLPAVIGFGALYLIAFLIEPALFGSASGYWLSVLLALALSALAARSAWRYRALPRLFFLLLAISFFCYAAVAATYQRPLYLTAVQNSPGLIGRRP